jgi:hypothetical protein
MDFPFLKNTMQRRLNAAALDTFFLIYMYMLETARSVLNVVELCCSTGCQNVPNTCVFVISSKSLGAQKFIGARLKRKSEGFFLNTRKKNLEKNVGSEMQKLKIIRFLLCCG